MHNASDDNAVEQAARRLERATALLEQRLKSRLSEAGAAAGGAFDQDRSMLATELSFNR